MSVSILYFAKLRELTNTKEIKVNLDDFYDINGSVTKDNSEIFVTYADIYNLIIKKHKISEHADYLNSCMIAVNETYCDINLKFSLKNGDEVSIIPPVSGG